MLLALWSAFFISPTPAPETGGGGGFDVKKYREYLERLNGITKDKITTTEVLEIQKISKAVKVKAPAVKSAVKSPSREINYRAIELEVAKIRQRILVLMEQAIVFERKRNQEKEVELILLMCV